MKKLILTLFLMSSVIATFACPACKKLQPKVLQGITHGGGPTSNWDYLIVGIMAIITLYVLAATVRCIARPSENQPNHIKRTILNN